MLVVVLQVEELVCVELGLGQQVVGAEEEGQEVEGEACVRSSLADAQVQFQCRMLPVWRFDARP